jgi:uncharacterized protein VirK/YbjX
MAIEQEHDLIELLESFQEANNNSSEIKQKIKQQIRYADRRIQDLEYIVRRRRERKSFVNRIETEVGQEKLRQYFTQHGLAHLYPHFHRFTLKEFQKSDALDWPTLTETELRQVMFLR